VRVGLCLLHDGEWDGRRLISREYLDEMRRRSLTEPRYGLGLWLAYNSTQPEEDQDPFLDEGISWLDGHSKQRVYIAPASSLVLVRVGENARRWNEAALPNAALRAIAPPAPRNP
jgi:CubicO group peptidase (beta-lactamase class C family)